MALQLLLLFLLSLSSIKLLLSSLCPYGELIETKLAPGQHPNLDAAQLQQLHDLCVEFADIFTTRQVWLHSSRVQCAV
jgi:hypothetical protein